MKLITFASREANLKALNKLGEVVAGNPFQRKLKTGKIITVKGRLRKAARKELLQEKARKATGRISSSYNKPVSRELINRRGTHEVRRFVGDSDPITKSGKYNEIRIDPSNSTTRAVRKQDMIDEFYDHHSGQHMGYKRVNGFIPEPLYEEKRFAMLVTPDKDRILTRMNAGLNRWDPGNPRHNSQRYYKVREILGRIYESK